MPHRIVELQHLRQSWLLLGNFARAAQGKRKQQEQKEPSSNNNCQAIKAAAIDFLSDKQIIALLPALHRQLFEAIKASKQQWEAQSGPDDALMPKWDSPQSIE